MFIIKNKKIFIGISIFLVIASIFAISVFGVRLGIDFKGGALTEVSYDGERISQDLLQKPLDDLGFGSVLLQPTGEKGYIVKSADLSEEQHQKLLSTLSQNGTNPVKEINFNSIGPSVGRELARKAIVAIILVALAIILFIAYAFRKVSEPVSSWKYGLIAIVTLLHDILIPIGIFSVLSHYFGAEADTLFVVAILTILGLSVSDTIVIFDRIRENLRNQIKGSKNNFSEIIGMSLTQSFARSIATSLTVILALLSLFFFGPATTKYPALMLTVGMFFGTYSSIFLASPLLVIAESLQKKK